MKTHRERDRTEANPGHRGRTPLGWQQVCALVGPNLQEGNAGFGDTAEKALADLVEQLDERRNALGAALGQSLH